MTDAEASFHFSRSDQATGQAQPHAGRTNRQVIVERCLADCFEFVIEHRIDNRAVISLACKIRYAFADGIRSANHRGQIDQAQLCAGSDG